jgi:hypothetical protein
MGGARFILEPVLTPAAAAPSLVRLQDPLTLIRREFHGGPLTDIGRVHRD